MRFYRLPMVGCLCLAFLPEAAQAQYEGYEIVRSERGEASSAFAVCPQGKVVIGGGYMAWGEFTIAASYPFEHSDGRVGWWVEGIVGRSPGAPYAYAICVNGQQGGAVAPKASPPDRLDLEPFWAGGEEAIGPEVGRW